MSNDQFYANAAQKRLNQLDAERLRAQHDLAVSLSQGDEDSAAIEIDQIAEIDAKRNNLIQLAQREQARQNPPPPAPPTDQEWLSKPAHKMDYSDVYRMAEKSKHGVDIEAFKRGIAEVAARRARGE